MRDWVFGKHLLLVYHFDFIGAFTENLLYIWGRISGLCITLL